MSTTNTCEWHASAGAELNESGRCSGCVAQEGYLAERAKRHKARTIQEVIDFLQGFENKDRKVAFALYTEYDIEGDMEYYEFPSLTEAWNTVVDDAQAVLNEGWIPEQVGEAFRELTEQHYELKE